MRVNIFRLLGWLGTLKDTAEAVGDAAAKINELEQKLEIAATAHAGLTVSLSASEVAGALHAVKPIAKLARKVAG